MKTKWFTIFAWAYAALFGAGVFWYGYAYFMLHHQPMLAYLFASIGVLVLVGSAWVIRIAWSLDWS